MKSADQIKKTLMGVSEEDQNNLEAIINDLTEVKKTGEISEDTCRILNNALTVISGMKEGYMWRLLSAAKQNHML
jgi:hypothetical protein